MPEKRPCETNSLCKLTPARQKTLCDYLARGNWISAAAAMAGISTASFYVWMKRGRRELDRLEHDPMARPRKAEAMYVRFWLAVDEAMARAEARNIQVLDLAAQGGAELLETVVVLDEDGRQVKKTSKRSRVRGQWQAAAWWLKNWSPLNRGGKSLKLTGVSGDEVAFSQEIDLARLSDAELAQLEILLEKCAAPRDTAPGEDPAC